MAQNGSQLTDTELRNLAVPPSGQVQYPDGKVPGFGIRVTAAGLKTFYFVYRFQGRSRRMTLVGFSWQALVGVEPGPAVWSARPVHEHHGHRQNPGSASRHWQRQSGHSRSRVMASAPPRASQPRCARHPRSWRTPTGQ